MSDKTEPLINHSKDFIKGVLDGLSHSIAIIDHHGVIVAVNEAWKKFARENGPVFSNVCEGANYLKVCEEAKGKDAEYAAECARCIRDIAAKKQDSCIMEYPCHSSKENRWYTARFTRFPDKRTPLIIVSHSDITELKQTKMELEKSEREKLTILNNMKDVYVEYIDPEMRLLWCSDNILRYLGKSMDEIAGKKCFQVLYGKNAPCDRCSARTALVTGEIQEMEQVRNDGKYFAVRSIPIIHETGKVKSVVHYGIDITELKRAEAQLKNKKEMLARTEAIAHVGSWEWDIETDTTTWSEELYKIFGRDPSLPAPTYREHPLLYHPEDMSRLEKAVEAAVSRASPYELEMRAIRADGTIRHCLALGFPKTSAEGKVTRLYGSLQDITRLKHAEREVHHKHEFLRLLMETIPTPVFHKDAEGKYTGCNRAFENFLGLSRQDIIGKTVYDIAPEHLADVYHEMDEKLLQGLGTQHYESRTRRSNGELRDVIFDKAAFFDSNTDSYGIIGVINDITERKRAEKQRLLLEQRLMELKRMESIGVMTGGIAHYFNNILMIVLGNIEMAKEEIPPHSIAMDNMKEAETATQRAVSLVKKMLSYSGKEPIEVKPQDLNRIISQSKQALESTLVPGVSLVIKPAHNLSFIRGDKIQLQNIIQNLVENAAESYIAGEKGKVTLTTGVMFCDADCLKKSVSDVWLGYTEPFQEGDYVFLEVSDSGCGMEKKTLKRIFEPFFTTKFQGRGLGLPAVMGIVRVHKGFIQVDSRQGKGSVFRVLFPVSGKTA